MPTYQITWQFQGNTAFTWNEVFYKDSESAKAATVTSGIIAARLLLLDPLNKLLGIRATNVDSNRDTVFLPINFTGTADLSDGPSVAGDAIVCLLGSAFAGRRKVWMRGAPDKYMGRNVTTGIDVLIPFVGDRLNSFFGKLESNAYGIRKIAPRGPTGSTFYKAIAVQGSPTTNETTITFATPTTWLDGDRVILTGFSKKISPGLNGRFTVLKNLTGGTQAVIPYSTNPVSYAPPAKAGGRKERWMALAPIKAEFCSFGYFGVRKTRNPITRSRGARRAVSFRTYP